MSDESAGVFSPIDLARRVLGDLVQAGWSLAIDVGTIRPGHRRARRFAHFGERSAICFPVAALFGEGAVHLGEGCIIGPYTTLSAGGVARQGRRGARLPHRG